LDFDISIVLENVKADLVAAALQAKVNGELSNAKIFQLHPVKVCWKLRRGELEHMLIGPDSDTKTRFQQHTQQILEFVDVQFS